MSDSHSPPAVTEKLTQHAMLVIWGLYARQIGLVEALEEVKLKQKTRTHRPQTKVLEFLVAMLAGLPHLQDISRSAHPLDQDQVTAEAWGPTAPSPSSAGRARPTGPAQGRGRPTTSPSGRNRRRSRWSGGNTS